MILNNDNIYISSYDPVLDEGNSLSVLNLKSYKLNQIKVKDKIRDMIFIGKKLYILGSEKIFRFDMFNKLKKEKEKKLKCGFKKENSVSTCFFRNNIK